MKFGDYFHARGIRTTSLFFGGISALMTGIVTNWQYGLLSGAVVALLASFLLPWRLYQADKPYVRIKEQLGVRFIFDRRVRFTVRGGTVGGYFMLTENSLLFLSLEQGEHRLELSRKDVRKICLGENMTISIFLNDKQFIRVISGDYEELYEVLRENGWTEAY